MENRPTHHEAWQEQNELCQSEVNDALHELAPAIEEWNQKLEEAARSGDLATVARTINEATADLDSKWDYLWHIFFVSGTWHQADVQIQPNGFAVESLETEVFSVCQSYGFGAHWFEDGVSESGTPRVGLSFLIGQVSLESSACTFQNLLVKGFAEPDTISLNYLRPPANAESINDLDKLRLAIDQIDEIHRTDTADPESAFYNLSADEQRQYLEHLRDKADACLPPAATCEALKLIYASAPRYYLIDPEGELAYGSSQDDIGICGTVHGFTFLELMPGQEQKRYGSPEELADSEAGLCMLVTFDESVAEASTGDNPVHTIIVPYRSLTNLSMAIK